MPTNEFTREQRTEQLTKLLKEKITNTDYSYYLSPFSDYLFIKSKLPFGLSDEFIKSLNEIAHVACILSVKGAECANEFWGDEHEFRKLKNDEGLTQIIFG